MENVELTPKTAAEFSPKQNSRRVTSQPKSLYRKSYRSSNDKVHDAMSLNRSSGQTLPLAMASTSNFDLGDSNDQNSQNSIAKIDAAVAGSKLQREYQLLAQKFHQYTINCRTTIRTLEKKLKKLIDDKHALLHGMISLRKGQKDVIKKYRKIFNDAMKVCFSSGSILSCSKEYYIFHFLLLGTL